jgi:hypothetical protein
MAAETVFDFVAEQLEQKTDFDKLEARGTVRLALKQSGLDAKSVTGEQMAVVLEKVLPGELTTRGVDSPDAVCEDIVRAIKSADFGAAGAGDQSPEAVFKRIGGG